jgi:hypothetical protein
MFRAFAPCIRLFAAAIAVLAAPVGGVQAQEMRTYIMPDDDGYGVADCLAAGPKSGCGRIVADAWCESKGFARARSFGRDETADVTGAIMVAPKTASAPKLASAPGVLSITCQN